MNTPSSHYKSMRTREFIPAPITDDKTAIEVISGDSGDAAENCYRLLREEAGYSIEQAIIYVLNSTLGIPQPKPIWK